MSAWVSVGWSSPLDRTLDQNIRVIGGCDLGVVGVSSIFGWVRGTGTFASVLPTFVLVSRIQLTKKYRANDYFLNKKRLHDIRQWSTVP